MLRTFGDFVPIAIITLPFFVLAWRTLVTRRCRTVSDRAAAVTAALDVAIVAAAIAVLGLVSVPVPERPSSSLHLPPGTDLAAAFAPSGSLWQVAGNLVLLAPLAALVPLRLRGAGSLLRVALAALAVSALIEVSQYLMLSGRVSSTDDVVLNTLGAIAGARLTRRWWLRRFPGPGAIPAPRRPVAPALLPPLTISARSGRTGGCPR